VTRGADARGQPVALRPRDSRSVRGLRILILDDEPAVLEALALILRGEGCHVVKCRTVTRALAVLRRGRWDAIVSDIAMPGADGYSFMRRLRDLAPAGRHLPAIALTAYARPQDEVRAIEAGFDVHLPKPVEADDLVDTIANIVERYPVEFAGDGISPRPARLEGRLERRVSGRVLDKRLGGRLERVRLERVESGFAIPDAAPLVTPSNDAHPRATPHAAGSGGRAKRGG
jgi:CheY-like chemotaxis protein